jgi:hypothetical protein
MLVSPRSQATCAPSSALLSAGVFLSVPRGLHPRRDFPHATVWLADPSSCSGNTRRSPHQSSKPEWNSERTLYRCWAIVIALSSPSASNSSRAAICWASFRKYNLYPAIRDPPIMLSTCYRNNRVAVTPAQFGRNLCLPIGRVMPARCEQPTYRLDIPGNSREMITMAERRFAVRIRIGVPLGGLGQHPYSNQRLAGRELLRWLGNDAIRDARRRSTAGRAADEPVAAVAPGRLGTWASYSQSVRRKRDRGFADSPVEGVDSNPRSPVKKKPIYVVPKRNSAPHGDAHRRWRHRVRSEV